MPRRILGEWDIRQGSFILHVQITGQTPDGRFDGRINVHGQAGFTAISEERVTDHDITFLLGAGRYNGHFGLDNRLTGHTFDESDPSSSATWFTETAFTQFLKVPQAH